MPKSASKILAASRGDNPEREQRLRRFRACAEVAEQVYSARTGANLTQHQLAERVGTSQSAIARIEDADYEGHSVRTLQRVADALGLRLSIQLLTTAVNIEATDSIELGPAEDHPYSGDSSDTDAGLQERMLVFA